MVAHPAAPAREGEREHFVALDSLRGLCAVGIVFYHVGNVGWIAAFPPFRVGWMLVDFFFVLSGFVIAMSYGSRLAHGYPRGKFLLIRLGRVYPLHIATVAGFVALEWLVFRPLLHEAHSLAELGRAVFLLDAFVRGAGNFFAPVSWAVSVELVLYLFAAGLFGRGKPGIAIAFLLAAASAWALIAGFNEIGFSRLLQRGLMSFPLGVACYWLHRKLRGVEPGPVALSVAELALFVGLLVWMSRPGNTAPWIPANFLIYAAIVLVFARDGGIVSRVLATKPLVWLGRLSFALYMVHLFYVIVPNRVLPGAFRALDHAEWVRPGRHTFGLESVDPPMWLATLLTLGVLALALATAWLAWRFVEEPARRWTRRFAPHGATPAVAGI